MVQECGPTIIRIREKPEIWIPIQFAHCEELANQPCFLKARAGQLKTPVGQAGPFSPASQGDGSAWLYRETLSADDLGLLWHHSEKRRLQSTRLL